MNIRLGEDPDGTAGCPVHLDGKNPRGAGEIAGLTRPYEGNAVVARAGMREYIGQVAGNMLIIGKPDEIVEIVGLPGPE